MTRREFAHARRILNSVEFEDVRGIERAVWLRFNRDRIAFIENAPAKFSDAIWAEVMRRMPKGMAAE